MLLTVFKKQMTSKLWNSYCLGVGQHAGMSVSVAAAMPVIWGNMHRVHIIGLNSMNPEWKFGPYMVYKLNCATLIMFTIYFQGAISLSVYTTNRNSLGVRY